LAKKKIISKIGVNNNIFKNKLLSMIKKNINDKKNRKILINKKSTIDAMGYSRVEKIIYNFLNNETN
jgi:hypothetical protein